MQSKKSIVKIQALSTGYSIGKRSKEISTNLNLSLNSGNLVALLGPNGCGKSTLLRTIAGLQAPICGNIRINDIDITKLKSKEIAKLLSLVLTDKINTAHLIVKDVVGIGRYPYTGTLGILSPEDKEIVQKSLEKCNLKDYEERPFAELSDGEKQRVLLARALAQDTPLMMLDEPTAHLDLPNRVELMKMLRDLAQHTKKAVLLSTHELDLALQWCDQIWLMNSNGEMQTGVPEDLVLNDSFSEIFSNNSFFFDKSTGIFKMNRKSNGSVYLKGDTITKIWTQRALEREGYFVVDNATIDTEFSIEVTPRSWTITKDGLTEQTTSIENLLAYIKTSKK